MKVNKEYLEIIKNNAKNINLPVFVVTDHGQDLYRADGVSVIAVDTEEDISNAYCLEDCYYYHIDELGDKDEKFLQDNELTEEDCDRILAQCPKAILIYSY